MQTLDDFELSLPGKIVCDYCGMLCCPRPACEFCGSPILQADMSRLAEAARLVEQDLARKETTRVRLEEERRVAEQARIDADLEGERVRLEEERRVAEQARIEAERKAEMGAERARLAKAEAERVRLAKGNAERVRLAKAEAERVRLAKAEAEAERVRKLERARSAKPRKPELTICVRCGQPSQGGFCHACRDALSELRGLSDEMSEYIKPPLQ